MQNIPLVHDQQQKARYRPRSRNILPITSTPNKGARLLSTDTAATAAASLGCLYASDHSFESELNLQQPNLAASGNLPSEQQANTPTRQRRSFQVLIMLPLVRTLQQRQMTVLDNLSPLMQEADESP